VTTDVLDQSAGIVFRSDLTTVIDTRDMPWLTFEGMGGSSMKPLAFFEDGSVEVMLGWIPPGKAQSIPKLPDRHYHRSVAEYFYLLGGEVYTWDYRNEDDPDGVLVHYRPDYYLDRQPGPEGIHGLEDGPVASCGTLFLNWRTGVGIWAGEPEFADESVSVPYPTDKSSMVTEPLPSPTDGTGLVYSTPTVRLLDTRAMGWQPYPELAPGAARKVLSTDANGDPKVLLLAVSASQLAPAPPMHHDARECFYVLSGELPIREYAADPDSAEAQTIVLKAGYFVDRKPGARHEIATDVSSAGDAILLYWRTASGSLPGDRTRPAQSVPTS
jgi:mannose-6-phosphate isomerase-like protein (cupin superfamily)